MLTINTSIKKNNKFLTATIGCFLRFPLTKHNLAYASLLARMQMNASLYFPTISQQKQELSELYDLQFEVVPQLFGNQIVLSYIANFVEPLELLDPNYTYEKIVEDLALIIEHPSFDEKLVSISQQQLIAEYQEIMQEPENIALDRFFRIWYQNNPDYADNFMGSISEISEATVGKMKQFADNLRSVPAVLIGLARDKKYLSKLLNEEFKYAGLLKEFAPKNTVIPPAKILSSESEVANNLQSQLLLGYGYKQPIDFREQIVGLVLAQYLAGDQSSKLFVKVREQLGAAYAVEATNFANNSLFLINAGINKNQATEAIKIIKDEMEQISSGKIDLDLLKQAKKSLANIQKIGEDHENWQLAHLLRNELYPSRVEVDRIKTIKSISEKQIHNFAQNLFLNESYLLK